MPDHNEGRPAVERRQEPKENTDPPPLWRARYARGGLSGQRARGAVAQFPELDCIRQHAPVGALAAAERRARDVGMTADHVVLASGLVSEEHYARAFAQKLGLAFEPLDDLPREACPVDDDRLVDAGVSGLLPRIADEELTLIVAPRGIAARRLCTLAQGSSELRRRLRVTTAARLRRFVDRHANAALGRRAAFRLLHVRPELSAGGGRRRLWPVLVAALLVCGMAIAAPQLLATVIGIVFSAVFLGWIALRAIGLLGAIVPSHNLPRRPEAMLPVYTVIVALYRETGAVAQLIASLDALDWPREKLDIKLVLEADDTDTGAALAAMRLDRPYEIVIAPDVGPRTKPKALNVALPFARGAFVAVFDAEDRPEPDQLRCAFEAFLGDDDRLACVQARLTIDNTRDNWLTRMFTAEYAGLFDVFLPGLARYRLPLPLGGSSNHFRTAVLRAVGGWDPYNITEDADLGVRLARFGYRSTVIASSTYEEAPTRLAAWLKQRRRWFQGWIQTWLVHMRSPIRLLRELGPAAFVTVQLVVGGTVFAALVHPFFVAWVAIELVTTGIKANEGLIGPLLTALYGTTFVGGYLSSVVLGLVGLARRRLWSTAWILILVPIHWMLLAIAAWQAAYKLIRDPYRWDKTEHGLARTSRMTHRGATRGGAKSARRHIVAGKIRLSSRRMERA